MSLNFNHIAFVHDGAVSPLFKDISAHFVRGWTGVIGPNGAGKTTLLRLAMGELRPTGGTVKRPGHIVFCPQRTDDMPRELAQMISATDPEACVLRGRLQVGDDWAGRWPTLSHGERKRAQISVALWQRPDALLVDEPTNHIDLDARHLLAGALAAFNGIGLLVSHDRELLDRLCGQCLFIDPPGAVMRPGGYTQGAAEADREEDCLRVQRQKAEQELERLGKASRKRQAAAAGADRRKSKRGLARGDSDGRAKLDLVRVSGKDGQAGRLANQLSGRLAQAQERVSAIRVKKRYAMNFWLEGSVSPRRRIFSIPAETIDLDGRRRLAIPELTMSRQERIAITGANGLGKSTLVLHVLRRLDLAREHLVYLPQEIDLARTREIMAAVQGLSNEQLGQVMTVVSALGSRPERLLRSLEASPGELRKVLLALGVIRRPHLIVMDEPTNHLDLPAIQCLEAALGGCPCGLLLVSHDLRFLSRITGTQWHLRQEGNEVNVDTNCGF